MFVHDLFRKTSALLSRPSAAEVEGTIADVRVVDGGEHERWLLKLDERPEEVFVFEPTAISPPRKKGQRVRIGYAAEPGNTRRLRADWIAAA